MWTLILCMLCALFAINQLEPWGLATFGLFGWWMAAMLIGGLVAFVMALLSVLLGWVVARGRIR